MCTGPPNALDAPKPTSSSSTTSTFGAPAGGRRRSIGGNDASASVAAYVVRPGTGRSGIGSTPPGPGPADPESAAPHADANLARPSSLLLIATRPAHPHRRPGDRASPIPGETNATPRVTHDDRCRRSAAGSGDSFGGCGTAPRGPR